MRDRPTYNIVRRRGVMLYATTMMISILVAGAGVTLVSLQFANRRVQSTLTTRRQAQQLGRAGTEWALAAVHATTNWRSAFTASPTQTLHPDGGGQIDVTLSDDDGDLLDDDTDAARITVASQLDRQTRTFSLTARPYPHATMAYTVAASGNVTFTDTATVNGPIYAKGNIVGTGVTVNLGAAAAFDVPAGSVVTPTLTPQHLNAPSYAMPAPDLSYYTSRANAISRTGSSGGNWKLEKAKFTSTYATTGTVNAYGMYWLDLGTKNLDIRECLIEGTLILTGSGSNIITLDKASIIRPGAQLYPSLIVAVGAGSSVNLSIPNESLSEVSADLDFNGDGDKSDTFTPYVSGLVYVSGASTTLGGSGWLFTGCLQAETVTIGGGVVLGDGETSLAEQLSPGFTDKLLHVVSGTTQEMSN